MNAEDENFIPLQFNSSMKGRFKLIRRKADTLEITEETPWINNVILNQGLERFGTGSIADYCKVGTNNAAPLTAQTALLGFVAATSTVQSTTVSARATAPYYGRAVRTYRFATGVAAGTLAEVGVGWATGNAANTLWCRALILDAGGNPTTITVLSDEVLDVAYELRIYPDLVDKVFQVTISGNLYDCILRAADVLSTASWGTNLFSGFLASGVPYVYNGALGAITTLPSGVLSAPSPVNPTVAPYAPGTLYRQYEANWGLDQGNLAGGISAWLMPSNVGAYKVSFSPAIPKTNVQVLKLTARLSWGRYP